MTEESVFTPQIILASGSPRRLELMHQAGFEVEVIPSHADENVSAGAPEEVVRCLSRRKAEDVARCFLEHKKGKLQQTKTGQAPEKAQRIDAGKEEPIIVLGADTIVARDADILGKPSSPEEAAAMLRSLSGRSHDVYTGVTLIEIRNGAIRREDTFSVRTKVFFCSLTEEEIQDYVATGDPMDKAGSYGIQGSFARYVEKIEGDYYNVVGLPVSSVYHRLKEWGILPQA
ncbi:MAG: Maf family protein [Lachnospiraceae bacterium]|nr:Maf family protein [Lachnospiraceae bacterium]